MKKEMKFNRLFVSLMIAGCTLGFVACSDDDDPQTPTEPKVEDVYGDYTGTMQTVLLDQSTFAEGEGEEPAGVDVAAQVKNDTVYFDEFPVRDLVVSIVGEESADAILEAIGKVSYKVGYEATMTAAKDSVYMAFDPKPLEISVPLSEDNVLSVTVEVAAGEKGSYEFETKNLNMGIRAGEVKVNDEPFSAFPVTAFTFEMKKK